MPLFNGNGSGSSNSSITYISSGTTIAPTITYNTGLGTVTIGDGVYRLFHTTNYTGIITEHNISGNTFLITEHITTYICSDYNNGNPILRTITDSSQFNWSNIIPIYTVTRDGDNLSFVSWDSPGNGLPNKIHDRLIRTDRFSRESGLDIGESAIRKIIVSSGIIWQGVYRNSMDSVDSSIDICKFWHTDALGEWIDESITQYNNAQYDTGTGLATLTDGNYAVNWIFRMIGNTKEIAVFLGDDDFDLNTAKASQLPNNVPASIVNNGMLIGRIIVLKGEETATQIDSAFVTKFAASTVTSHSGLTDLIGGANGLYYHSDQPINKDSDVEFNSIKNTTLIKDSTDATKMAQFDTSNISANIRVYDFPDVSGTIAVGLNNVTNHEQVRRSEMGEANGVATLDNSGKLTTSQIPEAILGGLNFQSLWNANTNTPAIPTASTLNKGYYYKVNVAGYTLIDGISDWTIGDWIVSNGTIWDKVDAYEAVTSVSGKTGDVTLVKGDVGLGSVTNDAQVKKIANCVNNHVVSWSGTSGDTVSDSGKSLPSGDILGTTDIQTLSNKTLSNPIIGGITQAQRLALTPVEGMEVFDTDNHGKYCYSNGRWCQISGLAQFLGYKTVDSTVSTNTDIAFVIGINFNMGTITSPSIPLKANKSYRIHAYTQIDGDGATAGARFAFVSVTDNTEISGLYDGVSYTATSTGHTGPQPVAGGLYRPTSDINIKLRVISISGSPKLMYETFRLEIQQVD